MNENTNTNTNAITEFLQRHPMTVYKLAQEIKLSERQIYYLKGGRSKITPDVLLRLKEIEEKLVQVEKEKQQEADKKQLEKDFIKEEKKS